MVITLPDPYPGRCENYRNRQRCLHRDHHEGKCVFPEPRVRDVHSSSDSTSWVQTKQEPEPWIPPWEK